MLIIIIYIYIYNTEVRKDKCLILNLWIIVMMSAVLPSMISQQLNSRNDEYINIPKLNIEPLDVVM